MLFMSSMALLMVPVMIAMILLPVAVLVALQVWLCKHKGKLLGLVLPGLSLLLSLILILSVATFTTVSMTGTTVIGEQGQLVQENQQQTAQHQISAAEAGAIAGMFLVFNIPTVVFGGIWLYYKNRRDWKDDLEKMKIEDLE